MTPADEDGPDRGSEDMLAAEYVVGALAAEERRAAAERIERDPVFARLVDQWEVRLSPLASATRAFACWACTIVVGSAVARGAPASAQEAAAEFEDLGGVFTLAGMFGGNFLYSVVHERWFRWSAGSCMED